MSILEKSSIVFIVFLFISLFVTSYLHYNKKDISNAPLQFDSSIQKKMLAEDSLAKAREFKKAENYIDAVISYRQAAKLHAEYMDVSSKEFLGDELKETIKFSIVQLNQKLREEPTNKDIIAKLKVVYKMEKNFGKGCE